MKTLISYPRSGAHWLMSLVDTYLGSDKKVDWQHLHDVRFYQWWEMPHLLSGEVENPEDGILKPTFRTTSDLKKSSMLFDERVYIKINHLLQNLHGRVAKFYL